MAEEYMSVDDAAKEAGVTTGAIYKAIERGKLHAEQFGKRGKLIKRADFEAWKRSPRQPGNPNFKS